MLDYKIVVLSASSLFLMAGLIGCAEPMIDEEEATQYADQWASSVEDYLQSQAVLAASSEALKAQFKNALEAESRQQPATPFAELMNTIYAEREYTPALVGDKSLSEAGEATWELLQDVDAHNLDPEPYQIEAIAEALEQWEERRESVVEFEALQATAEDRAEAVAWLIEQPESEFELVDANFDELTNALIEDPERGSRLSQAVEEYQDKNSAIAESASKAEQQMAVGLARYAQEQRHFRVKEIFVHPRHWDYYNEPDVDDSGRRPDPQRGSFLAGRIWRDAAHLAEEITEENEMEILDGRIRETVADVISSDDPAARIAAIAPQQPQYAGLVEEHRRYRDIVEQGGWEEVERRDNLRAGQSSPVVADLKRRLRVEGYFPDDVEITDTFDEDLTEAINAYQETHQMTATGRPHHVFWYSLNIPAERRLAQIRLNLDRWRETNVKHEDDTYAFINIPDFNIEMWHHQERIKRFATIVGDNERSRNPLTDETEHSNRTPTPMAAYIDRVIFNPYWNVTKRIRAVRILPEVQESIETKYALKINELRQQAQDGVADIDESQVTLASIRSNINIDDHQPPDTDENTGESQADSDVDESVAALADDVELEEVEAHLDGDGEEQASGVLEQLSEEEKAELRQKLIAEKTQRAISELTSQQNVYNEEFERDEQKRVFHTSVLRQLESDLHGGDSEAIAALHARFPYLDWETGIVDVESTDPDNIPSWYKANGYEVVHPGHHTWEYVRMLPGDENSLGAVKIIFPNYDNVYLHDTPARELFNRDVRGFSHGCIRLHRPLELSQTLLDLDGKDDNIDQILASEEYYPIFLDRQIPVYLEYYTVRIDDEGRANFLADIYDYDDEELGEVL